MLQDITLFQYAQRDYTERIFTDKGWSLVFERLEARQAGINAKTRTLLFNGVCLELPKLLREKTARERDKNKGFCDIIFTSPFVQVQDSSRALRSQFFDDGHPYVLILRWACIILCLPCSAINLLSSRNSSLQPFGYGSFISIMKSYYHRYTMGRDKRR